jgi:hypothetical protein
LTWIQIDTDKPKNKKKGRMGWDGMGWNGMEWNGMG